LHDYYLIFKEAVNNSAKYSEANLVTIEIKVENGKKSLMIRDNGKGFDLSKTESFGNGLTNMQKRAKKIGGRLSIQSQVDIGTSITLFL
jgi:signal transduction histidine kinase